MNQHRLIVEIREAHPLRYENFTKEQKQRLLDKCLEGKSVKEAYKEIRREIQKRNATSKDNR